MVLLILVLFLSGVSSQVRFRRVPRARAYIFFAVPGGLPNAAPIGTMDFVQNGEVVTMTGVITGLTPALRGFHIHQTGDISNGCLNAGLHFNPLNVNHGNITDAVRHVGDLGNLVTPASGITIIALRSTLVSLTDPVRSVIGRAIVLHQMTDDLGRGGNEGSLSVGNSGGRIACGVIGIM